jgi:U3 small nucleolar RNA-associated protein 3
MAKKRKAGGRLFGPRESDSAAHGNKKLRIDDWQDVADSEDEFHMNRDKILLEEGPAQKRQRKAQEEGQEIS